VSGWPGHEPQYLDDTERLISQGGLSSYGVILCSQGIAVETIGVPDICGICEIGTVELTVSRETLIATSDVSLRSWRTVNEPLINKLIADLRPAVVTELDQMDSYGMLPGRIDFLRGLASIFGKELLDATKLGWIPVTEPPGNLIHYSKTDLLNLLERHPRILMAIGGSPAVAYAVAAPHIPPAKLSKMLVIAIRKEEVKVGYELEKTLERERGGDVFQGSLDQLISMTEGADWNLVLTDFLLECVAEGWHTFVGVLRGQKWNLGYKDNLLWADLSKP
jgi:hypothetical protein